MDRATIIRTAVMAVALLNIVLQAFGFDALPFGDEQVESAAGAILAALASIWCWWKNNSVSVEAKTADKIMREMKNGRGKFGGEYESK